MVKKFNLNKQRNNRNKDYKRHLNNLSNNIRKKGRDNNKTYNKGKYVSPFEFTENDYIAYDITKYTKFTTKDNFNNEIHITNAEYSGFLNHLKKCQNNKVEYKKEINISSKFRSLLSKWKEIKIKLNNEELAVKEIMEKRKGNESLSVRKILETLKDKGLNISKCKIHRILRNRLNYKYRKTTPKNRKLLSSNSENMKKVFLKIIFRAISLGYNLLFVDESKIEQKNKNLRTWRKTNEEIYQKVNKADSINLTMGINRFGVLAYTFTNENNNSWSFQEFLEGLYEKLSLQEKNKTLLVMDNATIHVSKSTKKYMYENKIKYITNIPYLSEFNSIELDFRNIKQYLYSKTFSSSSAASSAAMEKIQSKNFSELILKNYLKTLNLYLKEVNDLKLYEE